MENHIINNDTADITDIPDDNPSNPSIKLIAFVTPIIHPIVITIDIISFISEKFKNGNEISLILTPNDTTIIAAIVCPNSFIQGFIVFISSTTQNADIINIPDKNPRSFFQYCWKSNKFIYIKSPSEIIAV